ncbi:hypothetical protein M125_5567 [Bacteroides fragilis str. 3998T(B)3]|uniref:Uncharacterized protein n=1 Tax=Bacteroides fragilis str. 3998T(B)3 TaxID=1339316 RepID=A0A015TZ88_BACFG|nr:hypothetical protein M125_5567 [Bacteroides fragilis str. 3998T(B)3]
MKVKNLLRSVTGCKQHYRKEINQKSILHIYICTVYIISNL